MELRPGVLHRVSLDSPRKVAAVPDQPQQPFKHRLHSAAAAAAGVTSPPVVKSSSVNSKADKQQQLQTAAAKAAAKPYQHHTLDLNPALARLEDMMRQQLKSKAAVHTKEKNVLLAAFAKVGAAAHVNATQACRLTFSQ